VDRANDKRNGRARQANWELFDFLKRNFFGSAKKKTTGVRHVTDVIDICVLAFRLRAGRGVR
jgi:hypothetical protein